MSAPSVAPVRSLKPERLLWTERKLDSAITSASFNGTDIFLITNSKAGYHYTLDLLLKPVIQVDHFGRIGTIACHGFHSYLLACGDNDGWVKLINTQRRTLIKNFRCGDLVTSISMNDKYILVGSANGNVSLFDRQGVKKHRLMAGGGFVHSTSIYGSQLLAAGERNVYGWEVCDPGERVAPTVSTQRQHKGVAWACFNPFAAGDYLIGMAGGHRPRWKKSFRPMLRRDCGPDDSEYLLSVRRILWGSVVCVRDLKSNGLIRQVLLDKMKAPQVLWLGPDRLFAIYPGSSKIMKAEFCIDDTGVQRPYLESVSLDVSEP